MNSEMSSFRIDVKSELKPTNSKISNVAAGIWKLDRYGIYEKNKWNDVCADESNMYLIFQNLSLSIIMGKTLIENMHVVHENIRMIRKNDSIGIMITRDTIKAKKLRIKLAGTNLYPGTVMAANCIFTLQKFVKVENELNASAAVPKNKSNLTNNNVAAVEHEKIPLSEHVSQILKKNITEFYEDNKDLQKQFPIEDIVEACMLDQDFPSFVATVHKTLIKKTSK